MSSFTNAPTDCLVFKFEEYDVDNKKLDNSIYVIYDKKNHTYLIRGRRRSTFMIQSATYSYECEFAKDLVDFLMYCFCPFNTVNEILYNYPNLPENPDDITYELLRDTKCVDNEISGYNGKKMNRLRTLRNLRMLRNVFNYY